MTAFLSDSGLLPNFSFLDAFGIKSGKLVNPADIERLDSRLIKVLEAGIVTADDPIGDTSGFNTDGELGIALSQATALARVANAPVGANPYTIIFEDDVGLYLGDEAPVGDTVGNPEKLERWSAIASNAILSAQKAAGWDVLFMGYCLEHCDQVRPGPVKELVTTARPLW
jgi:hypothetical protein